MRKMIGKLLVGILCFNLLSIGSVSASENQKALGEIAITNETASSVTTYSTLKGIYLLSGTASITQNGTGLIAAGGNTIARQYVSYISLGVTVQYYAGGGWHNYTGWTASTNNNNFIASSKQFYVPRGRYYCTRTTHTANGETMYNYSNGIWIG